MISTKTIRFCNEVINHPYVLLRILPFVGDFVGQSQLLNKTLYNEEVIDEETLNKLNSYALLVERNEDIKSLKLLIDNYKSYQNIK